MQRQGEFAENIAVRIGKRVEYFRTTGGAERLSVQALANRCTEMGLPLDRSVIAKLEKGLRQTITVGEIMVLAKALRIPPLLLIFPIGQEADVEALPGVTVDTWAAARWFTGDQALPGEDNTAGWLLGAEPIRLYLAHDQYVREWLASRDQILGSLRMEPLGGGSQRPPPRLPDPDPTLLDLAHRTMRSLEGTIRDLRLVIRGADLIPPPLPIELRHVDADQATPGR